MSESEELVRLGAVMVWAGILPFVAGVWMLGGGAVGLIALGVVVGGGGILLVSLFDNSWW